MDIQNLYHYKGGVGFGLCSGMFVRCMLVECLSPALGDAARSLMTV